MYTREDDLTVESVIEHLQTGWLGRPYQYLPETDSTNLVLAEMVQQGTGTEPPEGVVLVTDFQRRGRGRFQRRWEAPPHSSLLFSLLLRPDWPAQQMGWLGMIVSTAVVESVKAVWEIGIGVKWPNDLVVQQNGEWQKCGGLLVEGKLTADGRLAHAIIGLGLNVNIEAADLPSASFPATSLRLAAGRSTPLPRRPLLTDLLARIEAGYEATRAGRSPHPRWQRQLITLGKVVQVTNAETGRQLVGTAVQADPWGQLLIQDEAGNLHTVSAGDVTLRAF